MHSFSPDGKWLLWYRWTIDDHYKALSGTYDLFPLCPQSATEDFPSVQHFSHSLATPGHVYTRPAWFPDSRHWIETTTDGQNYIDGVIIHDVQNPNLIVTKKFSARAGKKVIQITPDNHLRAAPEFETVNVAVDGKPQTYFDTPLDAALPRPRLISIRPGAGWAHGIYHSPNGKYLLWHIRRDDQTLVQTHRDSGWDSLWLSNADGSNMHELGCIPHGSEWLRKANGNYRIEKGGTLNGSEWINQRGANYWEGTCLDDIFWLPDSKRVQFALDDFEGEEGEKNVYTLDVN